jgi:predicted DNA-binding transcriptional regulator
MAITGNLETFNFVDIFQILKKDKKDGILVIEAGNKNFAVYFKDGDLVYIREVPKVFYVYLDLDFRDVMKKDDLKDLNDVYRALVARLPVLLSLKKGKFSFTPGFIKYSDDIKPFIPLEKIIIFLSRHLSPEEVERKISDVRLVFEKSDDWEDIVKKANLNDLEKKVLNLINGERTVEQIKNELNIDLLTLQRILYGFLAAGIIKRKRKQKRKLGFDLTKSLLGKIIERIKGL